MLIDEEVEEVFLHLSQAVTQARIPGRVKSSEAHLPSPCRNGINNTLRPNLREPSLVPHIIVFGTLYYTIYTIPCHSIPYMVWYDHALLGFTSLDGSMFANSVIQAYQR